MKYEIQSKGLRTFLILVQVHMVHEFWLSSRSTMLNSTKYNCFKNKFYTSFNLLNTFNYTEFIIFQTHNSCNSVLKCQLNWHVTLLTTTGLMAVIITITSKKKCLLSKHLTFVRWHPIFSAYLLQFPFPYIYKCLSVQMHQATSTR